MATGKESVAWDPLTLLCRRVLAAGLNGRHQPISSSSHCLLGKYIHRAVDLRRVTSLFLSALLVICAAPMRGIAGCLASSRRCDVLTGHSFSSGGFHVTLRQASACMIMLFILEEIGGFRLRDEGGFASPPCTMPLAPASIPILISLSDPIG